MRRIFNTSLLREILRPLGQIVIFVTVGGAILSALVLILAILLRGSAADALTIKNYGVGLFTYTLENLPQVLVDGVTIGFVYAAIALGYTMVYGVLEFINFAHSEIFALGAFGGVELLIWMNGRFQLASFPLWQSYGCLILAILLGSAIAGTTAVIMERFAYRPLRGSKNGVSGGWS